MLFYGGGWGQTVERGGRVLTSGGDGGLSVRGQLCAVAAARTQVWRRQRRF